MDEVVTTLLLLLIISKVLQTQPEGCIIPDEVDTNSVSVFRTASQVYVIIGHWNEE